jgi:hypothetical protein
LSDRLSCLFDKPVVRRQNIDDESLIHEHRGDHAGEQLKGSGVFGLEFDVTQQQIIAQRYSNLAQYCILAGAEEGFDFQVLLSPFEKQLDLPARLVDRGNGQGGELRVVGQKLILLASFRVGIADQLNYFCITQT